MNEMLADVTTGSAVSTMPTASHNQAESASVPVLLKQVKQGQLLEGLQKLLIDVYGSRDDEQFGLTKLMLDIGIDPAVVKILEMTQGHPVANNLVDRLTQRLALTTEGQKQFQVLNMLYGVTGEMPRSVSEVASIYALSTKDVRHLSIMMRCRLESDQIRGFVEDSLRMLVQKFVDSPLYERLQRSQWPTTKIDSQGNPLADQIILLEKEAEEIVDKIDQYPTVNISGRAGTGKTSLALKVASQLLQRGKRVLFVVHSRFFAQEIQNQTRFYPGDFTVSTFHALCHQYAKEADIEIPSYRNNKVFNELFPELLISAVEVNPGNKFDAIIVEEGHSLLPNFWRALKYCLIDQQKGGFFYFYDPIVLALAKNKSAPPALKTINLTSQLRANEKLAHKDGGLEIYEAATKEEMAQAVARAVENLLRLNYRTDEIAILAADTLPKVSSSHFNLPDGLKLAATPGDRKRHILHTSLSSFRAMTKKAVVILLDKEIESLPDWKLKYLSYSAFSRANEKLILIGNIRAIDKMLPDNLFILNPESFEQHLRRL